MQKEILTKYSKETLQKFWDFVSTLEFDPASKDSSTVKKQVIKKLPPATAESYRTIASDFGYSLYNEYYSDMGNQYLYASFDAVGRGKEFYESCLGDEDVITKIVDKIDISNNFSDCFPIEDDYYSPEFL